MKSLFTPWRFAYVTSTDKHVDGECVFCRAYESGDDRATLTLRRWERSFALLNLYPYTCGHCMVAPIRHVSFLDEVNDATLGEMMTGARVLVECLKRIYRPHGFNVGFNLGQAAGAGIEEHMHLHIVPRWHGDTSFTTVIGDLRIHPEDLAGTYTRMTDELRHHYQEGS